jgi:hypothetical protein
MDRSEEMKQRVDAALAYGDLDQDDVDAHPEISLSRSSLNRRRNGEYDFQMGELYEIAAATGVPVWFLRYGWDGWKKELSPDELRQIADSLPPGDPPDN